MLSADWLIGQVRNLFLTRGSVEQPPVVEVAVVRWSFRKTQMIHLVWMLSWTLPRKPAREAMMMIDAEMTEAEMREREEKIMIESDLL